MTLKDAIADLDSNVREFAEALDGERFPASDRSRIGAALLDQSHEHALAITLLLSQSIYGAACSLLRGQFESMIRGIWLLRCATEEQLTRFQDDHVDLTASQIISEVEKALGEQDSVLSQIKSKSWKALSSFVHGGFQQAVRRITPESISPDYSEEEIVALARFSRFCFLLAAVETCYVIENDELALEWAHRL